MLHYTWIIFLVIVQQAVSMKSENLYPVKTEIRVVNNATKFLRSHSDKDKLSKFTVEKLGRGKILYKMGQRVAGDGLVAQSTDYAEWEQPKDVDVVLSYPESGVGATLSYIQILVDQSSPYGDAYVLDGGIGRRTVSVLIEAKNTYYFSYLADFYGY